MADSRLRIARNAAGGAVHVSGELDAATALEFERRLEQELRAEDGDLTVELSEVTFMDSTGVQVLIGLARSLQGRGRLILLAPVGAVRRTLELVEIERIPNLVLR